jgi:hypothetical protein
VYNALGIPHVVVVFFGSQLQKLKQVFSSQILKALGE